MLIWSCGTVRVNCSGLCKQVTMTKKEESFLKKHPGTTRWAVYGFLCHLAWYAKQAVHVVTNCCQPIAADGDETSTIKHWFSEKGEKVQKDFLKPPAVTQYNLYMGAVDMFDQYRSYVQIELRSRKFWHPLFWFIIESALINSWLLYKASRKLALLPVEYTLFSFRKSIVLAMVSEWEAMGCRHKTQSPPKKMQTSTQCRVHLKKIRENLDTRFTAADGHLSFLSAISLRPESNTRFRQMQCQHCKKRKTTYYCNQCETPLCKGVCFAEYHRKSTSPDPKNG
jgi:Transposase IS4